MSRFDDINASEFLQVALQAAKRAAEISRSYYAGNFTVTTKEDLTPVTQADVECEQAIRENPDLDPARARVRASG